MSNRIIITGANGFIGEELTRHFIAKGYQVTALVHNFPTNTVDGVEYVKYDMESNETLLVFSGALALVHCAYVRIDRNKNADEINYTGTKNLMEQCHQHNVKFVFISSFSAHEKALSHYGKTKLKCEQLIDTTQDLIIKPGLVIGKKGLASEIISKVKSSPFFPLVGNGKQPLQTVYIHDLCLAIEQLIAKNKTGIYHIAEENAISMKQFYSTIASALNKRLIFVPIPLNVLVFFTYLFEKLRIPLPISSDSVLGLKQLRAFDTQRDLAAIGIAVRAYDESILQVLD